MFSMYCFELRRLFRALVIWTAIVTLFTMIALAKFAGYHANPELLQVLEAMPRALLDAFNMQAFNLTTLEGFYGVMADYFYLFGATAAALWGAQVIARETFERTAEFTLTLPLGRAEVLTAKALASLSATLLFVALTGLIAWVGARPYNPTPPAQDLLLWETQGMALIALMAWALGLAIASLSRSPGRAAMQAVLVMLGLYLLTVAERLHESLAFLQWLSPFSYFDAATLRHQGGLPPLDVALVLAATAALVAIAYRAYRYRDITL